MNIDTIATNILDTDLTVHTSAHPLWDEENPDFALVLVLSDLMGAPPPVQGPCSACDAIIALPPQKEAPPTLDDGVKYTICERCEQILAREIVARVDRAMVEGRGCHVCQEHVVHDSDCLVPFLQEHVLA